MLFPIACNAPRAESITRIATLLVGVVILVGGVGCSREDSATGFIPKRATGAGGAKCSGSEANIRNRLLPDDLNVESWGTPRFFKKAPRFVAVALTASASVDELYRRLTREVEEAGYNIDLAETEGFEAEIFFTVPPEALGAIRLADGLCPDAVVVSFFYQPSMSSL